MAFPTQAFRSLSFPFLRASVTTTLCRLSATAPSFLVGFCIPGRNLFQPRNKDQTSSGRVHVFFICVCSHMSAARWNLFPFTAPQPAPTGKCFCCNYFHKLVCGVGDNKRKSRWKCWSKTVSGFVPKKSKCMCKMSGERKFVHYLRITLKKNAVPSREARPN